MKLLSFESLASFPDPNTQPDLLPGYLVQQDNAKIVPLYNTALRAAIRMRLNEEQRQLVYDRYDRQYSLKEIAERFGTSTSTIHKRLKVIESTLRDYISFCVEVEKERHQCK